MVRRDRAGHARPDVLERPDAQLLQVEEARLVAAAQVLVAVLGEKGVVGLGRLPAVDHDVAVGLLDVAQQLGADVAGTLPEELRPVAVRARTRCSKSSGSRAS